MKQLMENWKRFLGEELLNENLVLKPGPNGWDLYGKLVAKAYEDAEDYQEDAVRSYKALIPFIATMYERIQSEKEGRNRVKVEFVDEDPYMGDKHMKQEVAATGILKIYTGGTEHPVFSHEFNLKFRAVHDWMAHIQIDTNFGMAGEIQAYNGHTHTAPPAGLPALFTEVVGQAAYFNTYGFFPKQKVAILRGFDFKYVGRVDGYDIVEKELVKRKDNTAPNIEDKENETLDGEL